MFYDVDQEHIPKEHIEKLPVVIKDMPQGMECQDSECSLADFLETLLRSGVAFG